ncbi:MAG: NB-ARC domain-containing protein [Actinomycetota bacterium]|nr:NB-ARC domain-containing protein [Actinomycetota bacterium]
MVKLPEGTVTFLFTDIEGSTRLLASLGESYGDALADHRRLLREAFSSSGGVEVDTQGDAFFYAFARAQDAVTAAVAGQRALSSHDFGDGVELKVRMGIHTGEPARSQEGYVGPDVHLGSRICSVAWGDQIVVSSATAAVISRLKDVTLRPLGDHTLKDIDQRMALHQVVAPGLRQDFPALRSVGAHPTNLPPRLPALIGRDQDIAAVTELVSSPEISVVTLVGPGGTGKTRLSLALAAEMLPSFPDGVFFVDLSALSDPSLVIASIAQVLSLRETPGRSLEESLTDHLASKEVLLVLDNFEQVMQAASQLSSLLQGAKALKVVVTSREALRISGERVVSVAPLELPSSSGNLDEVMGSPAVALFVTRAQAVKADFSLTTDNAADVAAICRRLDGLPLALELAAARINLLSPSALLARLDQGLKVLSAGRRDASDRQRTLRGAIAWSYELLSQDEQSLFRRLAVFAGSWSLEAAQSVCDRGDLELDVLDGLASLADKSLLRASAADADRFTMLETIREFALEKLEESGESEEIRRAHADHFKRLAEEAEPHLIGDRQKEWLDRLEVEHDNLRAALTWSLDKAPELCSHIAIPLIRFWGIRGHITEGRQWLGSVLDRPEVMGTERLRATQGAALLAEVQDEYGVSIAHAQEALSLARLLGDKSETARALIALCSGYSRQGDVEPASLAIEEAVALAEAINDPHLLVRALNNLAAIRDDQHRRDEATSLYEKSAAIAGGSGDKRGLMMALLNLGEAAAFGGEQDSARSSLHRVLALAQELKDPLYEAGSLINLGIVDLLMNEPQKAIPKFKRALSKGADTESTYEVVSCLDGLAAAIGGKDIVKASRLFAASDSLRARAGLPRSLAEEALYQPKIDALRRQGTSEEQDKVMQEEPSLEDAVVAAHLAADAALSPADIDTV